MIFLFCLFRYCFGKDPRAKKYDAFSSEPKTWKATFILLINLLGPKTTTISHKAKLEQHFLAKG